MAIRSRIAGKLMDWVEAAADAVDDPTSHPAGAAGPHYNVSAAVTLSRDHGIFVYHLPDDQLGQGSSLGNYKVWAETKGNGYMLDLFSMQASRRIMGGMSLTYLLPFTDITSHRIDSQAQRQAGERVLSRAIPTAIGAIHLHPAYQQRETVIGDGLHVLETVFVPRSESGDDPAAARMAVELWNRTAHPVEITVVATLALRGATPMDLHAHYDSSRHAILAWNESSPDFVRVFGSPDSPSAYWATNDKDGAYNPRQPLPCETTDTGDLTAALQFDALLLPNGRHKFSVTAAFSPYGRKAALKEFDEAVDIKNQLRQTCDFYSDCLGRSVVDLPDDMLTHGIQWAKACLVRPIAKYKVGVAATNDPGNSTHIVGRDTAWYVHGCDFMQPEWSCSMLSILARFQREDGLIPEFLDGNTECSEDFDFNINDDTPLFVMAVEHHVKVTGHWHCMDKLYPVARAACELILSQRDENGLVKCTATGIGPQAICGWRNVLQNQSISGVVTEVNSECFAALRAMSSLAEMAGKPDDAERYGSEAELLRNRINEHLVNPENGLYILNISPDGHTYTQASGDLVFPLICGVAEPDIADAVTARLAEEDFMTDAGIRVLPSEDPEYDPSFESGCMGGVWQGLTWWYAMAAAGSNPDIMANSLRRAYMHYVLDPKAYNTVPGQFSEWSDGQTLVNRGMRLSPWDPPRFLWAAVEGLAGIKFQTNGIRLEPRLPVNWQWIRVHNVLYRDGHLSFFLARHGETLAVYSANSFDGDIDLQLYETEMVHPPEAITTGIASSAFQRQGEVVLCFGSSLDMPMLGPFLAHHAIDPGKTYHVTNLSSHHPDWRDLGVRSGNDLQRIVVRIEGRGYEIYKFTEQQ